MSNDTYSTYEAKAKFSELLRKVKKNRRVIITSRGKPIAELIPFATAKETLLERLARLEEEGIVERDGGARDWFEPIGKSDGALGRFLKERGE